MEFYGSCTECVAQFNDKSAKKIYGCARCGKIVCGFHSSGFLSKDEGERWQGKGHRCAAQGYSFDPKQDFMSEEDRKKYDEGQDEQRRINALNGNGYLTDEELRTKSLFEESQNSGYVPVEVSAHTTDNKFNHDFLVPKKTYSDLKYKEKLDKARILEEVDRIINDYKKHANGNQTKHWWK